jgi:2-oxoglutarate-Fe(II)-dependent dioxygenase family protein
MSSRTIELTPGKIRQYSRFHNGAPLTEFRAFPISLRGERVPPVQAEISRIQRELEVPGYVKTSDLKLGFGTELREVLMRRLFNDPEIVRHHPGDVPKDRKRARDVVEYYQDEDTYYFSEYPTIELKPQGNITERPKQSRFFAFNYPLLARFISMIPSFQPSEVQNENPEGTIGINAFITQTDVVTDFHSDNERYVILYCVNKIGSGGETTIQQDYPLPPIQYSTTLEPGDIFIFTDHHYRHYTSGLKNEQGQIAQRSMLVCTIDDELFSSQRYTPSSSVLLKYFPSRLNS